MATSAHELHETMRRDAQKIKRRKRESKRKAKKTPDTNLNGVSMEDQKGQGLAEYALILALIVVISFVALQFFGTQISEILSRVGADFN